MRYMFFVVLFLLLLGLESTAMAGGSRVVLASWYGGSPAMEGAPMANGEPFRSHDKTIAAHKTLRFGTRLLVTNPANGRRLIVVVKDRGPFPEDRDIDLSLAAARELGYVEKGVTRLAMKVIHK